MPFFLIFIVHPSTVQDAREIVKKADDRAKGETSIALITIQTIRPNWSREMTVKSWTKGNDFAMVLVTAPVKEKGVVYLKRKKEVWNWIPAVERNIKLPPSMMSQSWMGTDFTNDDLVKEASIVEDYQHLVTGDTVISGRNCYKIEMLPKPGAAVVWGKILMMVDKKDYLILHAEYYDEDKKLINTLLAGDIKLLGGKLLPGRLEMIPAEKKGNKTVLIYTSLEFDTPIADNFFTTQNMPKVK
ncbi:MAG: outer membrane lipoprotein-sorting protein [Chitinophagales bacterium]|nr:outer membrane lipoprotein-sorting protein [Chitinophagales bacterium]